MEEPGGFLNLFAVLLVKLDLALFRNRHSTTRIGQVQRGNLIDNLLVNEVVGQRVSRQLFFESSFAVHVETLKEERQWSDVV